MACNHILTMGKKGLTGSWCINCGVKVLEEETRPCKECKHYVNKRPDLSICSKKLMSVPADMCVTYFIKTGTCFEPKNKQKMFEGKKKADTHAQKFYDKDFDYLETEYARIRVLASVIDELEKELKQAVGLLIEIRDNENTMNIQGREVHWDNVMMDVCSFLNKYD